MLSVEKVDIIAEQEKTISTKDDQINSLQKIVEQLEYDVEAYKSTVEELQLKFKMETGPFNVAARVFNVEELQNNHKEQIAKLDSVLEEQRKKIEILVRFAFLNMITIIIFISSKEKDRIIMENDLKRAIENSNENEFLQNNTIKLLNNNIESAQNQCKDLLSLVEMLTKENEHYRSTKHSIFIIHILF